MKTLCSLLQNPEFPPTVSCMAIDTATSRERIGAKVRQLRVQRGLYIHQLAAAADVSRWTVSEVEAGRGGSDVTYGRIALALDVPLADLLQEEGST